jgi:hypothetical protein
VELSSELPVPGFVTTRWVAAPDEATAAEEAFRSAKAELAEKWPDIRTGVIAIDMEVEDIWSTSPWRLLLRGAGRGFSFYERE